MKLDINTDFEKQLDFIRKEKKDILDKLPLPSDLLSQANRTAPSNIDFSIIQTPCFIIDETLLEDNLNYLKNVAAILDINILLAQKAYSLYASYPLISKYLSGTTSSGIYEAQLADKFMGQKEIHVFSPAYKYHEFFELYKIADYLIFNSINQLNLYREFLHNENLEESIAPLIGLRLNPEKSTTETELYDPSSKGSRLGICLNQIENAINAGFNLFNYSDTRGNISGFHIHSLCEQNSDAFACLASASIEKFNDLFKKVSWLNFGGGHHFTRKDYDITLFAEIVYVIKNLFPDTKLYFEPGEAVVLDTAWLVSEVQDIVNNKDQIAILDVSAECHCPDVLEMPYRPRAFLLNEDDSGKKPFPDNISYYRLADDNCELDRDIDSDRDELDNKENETEAKMTDELYRYRLGGPSCLAGDYFAYYSFKRKLKIKDRIVFCDMALYSFVKSNHFNGMIHPDIYLHKDNHFNLVKKFSFSDFESHLGNSCNN